MFQKPQDLTRLLCSFPSGWSPGSPHKKTNARQCIISRLCITEISNSKGRQAGQTIIGRNMNPVFVSTRSTVAHLHNLSLIKKNESCLATKKKLVAHSTDRESRV